jgi:hypothetical protein
MMHNEVVGVLLIMEDERSVLVDLLIDISSLTYPLLANTMYSFVSALAGGDCVFVSAGEDYRKDNPKYSCMYTYVHVV